MRRLPLLLLAATVALTALAGTAWTRTQSATADSYYVSMQGNRFHPATIAVPAGSTVVWTNEDYDSGEWHDLIATNGAFFMDTFGPGNSVAVTFDTPGTYEYYCDIHDGMYGTVVVQ